MNKNKIVCLYYNKKNNMSELKQLKEEALKQTIEQGNEYGYVSWDGLLDICDENNKIYNYVIKQTQQLLEEGKIDFELDW